MNRSRLLLIAALTCWAVAGPHHSAAQPQLPPVSIQVDEPINQATSAQGPAFDNYFTGFEAEEGFIPRDPNFPTSGFHGWLNGQPGNKSSLNWQAYGPYPEEVCPPIGAPCREGHISAVHPDSGDQHLRIMYCPNLYMQCEFPLIACKIPAADEVVAQPPGPYRIELQIAISQLLGSEYRIQAQRTSQGMPSTAMLFHYDGSIWVLDEPLTEYGHYWHLAGAWDADGGYQPLVVDFDPCNQKVHYDYSGELIYSSGCISGQLSSSLWFTATTIQAATWTLTILI